ASVVTLKTFCAMLGGFAGNVALTIGARSGVYIGGGILPRFPEFLAASDFRDRFEAKGRFRDWLAPIPTFVVIHPDPAFPGLMAMLKD
ncbi:MAG: glucokinase, partial [Proteobacteria bacterium]|nr:glucokinase [Pseudomonadota bacterium]